MTAVIYKCWVILYGNLLFRFCLSAQVNKDDCRLIEYHGHEEEKALVDHVITKTEVPSASMCKLHCFLNHDCVSVNFGSRDTGKDNTCELNNSTDGSYLETRQNFTYYETQNACHSTPCQNNGTCQYGFTAKMFRCLCSKGFHGEICETYLPCGLIFDFEHGLTGWSLTGTAFKNQPTYADNPTARGRGQPSNHKGDWWIGSFENRPSPSRPAGRTQGDRPKGTMTSPIFVIGGNSFKFLIGGGCYIGYHRAELIVEGTVVLRETGDCHESMIEKSWDVSGYIGKQAQLRLIDSSSGPWGHINFDHFEEICH